jgi:hypothetical protein
MVNDHIRTNISAKDEIIDLKPIGKRVGVEAIGEVFEIEDSSGIKKRGGIYRNFL